MAENKARTKMRKNRVTIDDKYMGPEPVFQKGETLKDENRRVLWGLGAQWYNYYYKSKDYSPSVLSFATEQYNYTKADINALKKLKDYELCGYLGKVAKLHYRGYEYNKAEFAKFKVELDALLDKAHKVAVEEIEEDKKPAKAVISIQDRQRMKIIDTIYCDWDDVVCAWIEGDYKATMDTYALFKTYDLKGSCNNIFKEMVLLEYNCIKDAYDKSCEQAVEAYEHIKRSNLKKMINTMELIFSDLDKLKVANKATKIPRAKKPKASDVQIKNLKYKTEDIDNKVSSINPVMIPGKEVLFVYNTKSKKLIQYVTNSTKGFEIAGTTIKNVCEDQSRATTLRKPDEMLPIVLSKSIKQIDKQVWDVVTTKINIPNGRINNDCILLRAL